jgi:hypothetical protein
VTDASLTRYGFQFGAAEVTRLTDFKGTAVIEVSTTAGRNVQIYVSPKGKSLRVFRDGKEMRRG